MIDLVLAILLHISVLQGGVEKKPASANENPTSTQSAKPSSTATNQTTLRIGSGGWDEKN